MGIKGSLTPSFDNGMPAQTVAVGKEVELSLGPGVDWLGCRSQGAEERKQELPDHVGGGTQSRPVGSKRE